MKQLLLKTVLSVVTLSIGVAQAQDVDSVQSHDPDGILTDLETTLQDYQDNFITFSPGAVDFIDDGCNDSSLPFFTSFKGLTKSLAYYYYFRELNSGSMLYAYDEESLAQYGTADSLLNSLETAQIKTLIDDALVPALSTQDKIDLKAFLTDVAAAYQPFQEMITPENDKLLRMVAANSYNGSSLSDRVFYELGLPKPEGECYDAQDTYTTRLSFGRDNSTYFVIGSLDFYAKSFWLRRYRAGTSEKAKELIDYTLSKL